MSKTRKTARDIAQNPEAQSLVRRFIRWVVKRVKARRARRRAR